jgi:hypothetical protein
MPAAAFPRPLPARRNGLVFSPVISPLMGRKVGSRVTACAHCVPKRRDMVGFGGAYSLRPMAGLVYWLLCSAPANMRVWTTNRTRTFATLQHWPHLPPRRTYRQQRCVHTLHACTLPPPHCPKRARALASVRAASGETYLPTHARRPRVTIRTLRGLCASARH